MRKESRSGSESEPPAKCDVCLVLMPYADIARPSLALGILKASLAGTGLNGHVEYANLRFAEAVGREIPEMPYVHRLLGEWVFSAAAFPERPDAGFPFDGGQNGFASPEAPEAVLFDKALRVLRSYAPHFVNQTASRVLTRRPRIVGCSSTFEQHCASLALLRTIKASDPTVITLLGGANCEGDMGWATLREFPWVDYVVSGEADELFPHLCRQLIGAGRELRVEEMESGVLGRAHVRAGTYARGTVPRAMLAAMDCCPVPDYSDYFEALEQSPLREYISPGLMVETSRGCWWGQKSHCTFCGLNGAGMDFRRKSAPRALEEMATLSRQYSIPQFMVVDNILDMRYFNSVLPELARQRAPYKLFYETKANLRRDQVRLLAEAGVMWIQPGIEGFHDGLLRLMAKGNSAMINLQLLKYTREFGIYSTWLMLFGFPGEDDDWHAETAAWLPQIFHLQPPKCVGKVLYDRFSLYQQNPEKYGLRLRPAPAYESVYPVENPVLEDLAYFFSEVSLSSSFPPGVLSLIRQVVRWSQCHRKPLKPVLTMKPVADGSIEIFDTRPCATARRHILTGLAAKIYSAADPAASRADLKARILHRHPETAISNEDLNAEVARLISLQLVLGIGHQIIALAVPGSCPAACQPEDFPGGATTPTGPLSAKIVEDLERSLAEIEKTGSLGREAVR